jgi:glutamate--cysteine ligase catalytic subunit
MPISAVDVNMSRAQMRDAVCTQKFYWRKHMLGASVAAGEDPDAMVELTVSEIINGTNEFEGLIALMRRYMATKLTDSKVAVRVEEYLSFIADRAAGKLLTGAAWQRKFVLSHPLYKKDSVVSTEIVYDMLKKVAAFESGPSSAVRDFYKI